MTKALEIVSTIKLQKMKQQTEQYRDFLTEFLKIAKVVHEKVNLFKPTTTENNEEKKLIVVLSTDKGLCGAINSKLFKNILHTNQTATEHTEILCIGKKAKEFFERKKFTIPQTITIKDNFAAEDLEEITTFIHKAIINQTYSCIQVYFNYFQNTIKQSPVQLQLLPFDKEGINTFVHQVGDLDLDTYLNESLDNKELLLEPSNEIMRKEFMNQFMEHLIYGAVLQNKTGEFASRMLAMKNAKDNASEVIDDLTLQYNKIRQGAITQEISEIVSAKIALE